VGQSGDGRISVLFQSQSCFLLLKHVYLLADCSLNGPSLDSHKTLTKEATVFNPNCDDDDDDDDDDERR